MKNLELIFDNAGGITLQTDDYTHFFGGDYDYAKQAAEDVKKLVAGESTGDWEGDNPDERIVNREYCDVMDEADIRAAIANPPVIETASMGYAQCEFIAALTGQEMP